MSAIGYVLSKVRGAFARYPALLPWLRQTSTILGMATAAGIVTATMRGTMTWDVAVPGLVGALVSMLLPGHADVATAARQAALDAMLTAQHDPRSTGVAGLVTEVATVLVTTASLRAGAAEGTTVADVAASLTTGRATGLAVVESAAAPAS